MLPMSPVSRKSAPVTLPAFFAVSGLIIPLPPRSYSLDTSCSLLRSTKRRDPAFIISICSLSAIASVSMCSEVLLFRWTSATTGGLTESVGAMAARRFCRDAYMAVAIMRMSVSLNGPVWVTDAVGTYTEDPEHEHREVTATTSSPAGSRLRTRLVIADLWFLSVSRGQGLEPLGDQGLGAPALGAADAHVHHARLVRKAADDVARGGIQQRHIQADVERFLVREPSIGVHLRRQVLRTKDRRQHAAGPAGAGVLQGLVLIEIPADGLHVHLEHDVLPLVVLEAHRPALPDLGEDPRGRQGSLPRGRDRALLDGLAAHQRRGAAGLEMPSRLGTRGRDDAREHPGVDRRPAGCAELHCEQHRLPSRGRRRRGRRRVGGWRRRRVGGWPLGPRHARRDPDTGHHEPHDTKIPPHPILHDPPGIRPPLRRGAISRTSGQRWPPGRTYGGHPRCR